MKTLASPGWPLAVLGLIAGGCFYSSPVHSLRYTCQTDADCATGFVCVGQVCTAPSDAGTGVRPDAGCNAASNTQTDPENCGACGRACPIPLHAAAVCTAGVCSRGPCDPGFFDLDGPVTFGCEASCTQNACGLPDGGSVIVTALPLPEQGIVFSGFAAGGSYGAFVETNPRYTNIALLGEATPPEVGGYVQQTNFLYINVGGFAAIERSK